MTKEELRELLMDIWDDGYIKGIEDANAHNINCIHKPYKKHCGEYGYKVNEDICPFIVSDVVKFLEKSVEDTIVKPFNKA